MVPELRFYNSLTKAVAPFAPLETGKVRVYNCGPTVYKRQHLGNLRRYLFADCLRRTLEHFGYAVRDITNITDVGHLIGDTDQGEDKLEKAAKEEKVSPQAIASKHIKLFKQDLAALNIKPAHLYPRASQHVPQMIALIERLLVSGHAYKTSDGIYFSVETFPEYGRLSGNRLENLKEGARVAVRGEKKHPNDFALWKYDADHLQQWASPWGRGFPGWHIECSAMSAAYLGDELDIHTGGEDNKFPHHENEIAQSEAASGKRFVRFWLHNAHLQLGGKKMAKREGAPPTLDDLIKQGYAPLAFRLFVFGAHYRHPLDFSWEALGEASGHLETIAALLRRLAEFGEVTSGMAETTVKAAFDAALADDLNTPEAWAVVLSYLKTANAQLDKDSSPALAADIAAMLTYFDSVLGIIEPLKKLVRTETVPATVERLATEREAARKAGDFPLADELRVHIEAQGYHVEDTPRGPRLVRGRSKR